MSPDPSPRRSVYLLVLALCLPGIPARATPPTGYELAWADEFEGGSLDATRWQPRTDAKLWSAQRKENLSVRDGALWLELKKEPWAGLEYTGAGVISKPAFKYGYYEARFRVPPTKGWHTSFWLMYHDGSGGTGPGRTVQELDVCENDSIHLTRYGVNTHQWNPTHKGIGQRQVPTPDLSADFHVFGCEFTPERITYYFDDQPVLTVDATQIAEYSEQHIWLTSIAAGLGGTDAVDEGRLPVYAVFDYVRYYTLPSRP